jgi:hypothetical protein
MRHCKHLVNNNNNILVNEQFEFRAGISTIYKLLYQTLMALNAQINNIYLERRFQRIRL